jgi:hypothetical protein
MKIYEAADLAPDTYAGEYFQPSVKVYKKEDVDEEIIKKGELLKEMAEALDDLVFECDGVFNTRKPSRETYNKAFYVLQKYREQAGDTNAE